MNHLPVYSVVQIGYITPTLRFSVYPLNHLEGRVLPIFVMKSYTVDLASTWCMMRCSHSRRHVLNDKRKSDDLRNDGNLFHSKQAFGTIEKRLEFVCEKGYRYKLVDTKWPEVALGTKISGENSIKLFTILYIHSAESK